VSCTSPSRCVAVGVAGFSTAGGVPFSESWNGTVWTAHSAPLPSGDRDGQFNSVSCRPGTPCMAVGETKVTGGTMPLAESWNGRHWTVESVPSPSGNNVNDLQGVSCRTAALCTAVGDSGTGSAGQPPSAAQPLVVHWNGTAWAIVSTPHLGGATADGVLAGVSCPRTAWCAAVGVVLVRSKTKTLPVAERWNGARWARVAVPTLPRTQDNEPASVSCWAKANCITTGSYQSSRGMQRPLAELDS
jgi:hypothetical protein